MSNFKKVIIWGHKNDGHTHSYIHAAYYKAFKFLGYDTYYFEDNEYKKLKDFNFENSLFFTEDQAQKNIPLIKSSKYILHHVKLGKYLANNINFISLGNYLKYCDDGVSAYFKEDKVVKVADCCFWDEKNKIIYQPWATDLLPYEIDSYDPVPFDAFKKVINYIGEAYKWNKAYAKQFKKVAAMHGVRFKTGKNISNEDSIPQVRESFLTVDIRGDWHIECGYLPCRVFKNISYGKFIGINSENIRKIFGEYVAYEPDVNKLFDVTLEAYKNLDMKKMKEAMDFVKNKHTYVNRIQNLLKFV